MSRKILLSWITVLTAFTLAIFLPSQAMASPPRISFLPDSALLAPGQSQAVTITLDNPIICPTSPNPCNVVLDFSASQALGVSVTPSVVTFADTAWFTPQTVTVALDINTTAQYPQAVNLVAVAASNSEYYRGFRVSFPVSLNVPDIRPPLVVAEPTLANTSAPIQEVQIASTIAVGALATGTSIIAFLRRNKNFRRRSSN